MKGTYVDEEKTLKVFGWVGDQFRTIGCEDSGMAIILGWVFALCSEWGVELDAFSGDGLEGSQCESASLDGVSWSDEL